MAVIWGLDLREMKWNRFKGSYMFNRTYHLRRSKMIVYQIAMILCICSESVGTAALDDYVHQQRFVEGLDQLSAVYNNDFVGVASYNIFVGIAIATIFGAGFFFDLFFPERQESKAVRLAWKISAVVVTTMALASAIAMTVIVATRSSYVSGVDAKTAHELLSQSKKNPNLVYRHNAYCVASVVLLWPGWVAAVASTIILFASHRHDDQYGPKSALGRQEEEEALKNRERASSMEQVGV